MNNAEINALIELIKEIAASQAQTMGIDWCTKMINKLESLKNYD